MENNTEAKKTVNTLKIKSKKGKNMNVPKIQKKQTNRGRRQTFGEIQEMDIQMEQT